MTQNWRPVWGDVGTDERIRRDLRTLVARPAPPTQHFAPLIEQPPCPHCGSAHMASWPCAEKQWNLMQKGKTP